MFSLVTACMNRDAHLRRTLPQWLELPGLAEVVVVDWSNRTSLRELTALDPRVRVIRVEGEPRWILSYAYNLGVSHARHDVILKCDADCVPTAQAAQLQPAAAAFHAGHWRSGAAVGKPSVNGQCLFSKAQFERVNGYSEVIRMYGRDDEDFYDRLIAAGFARQEIPPAELSFLEHTQQERLSNQVGASPSDPVEALLRRQPSYFEMCNLALTKLLPWGPWQAQARYAVLEESDNFKSCRRDTTREIPIAGPLQAMARLHGVRSVTAKLCQLPAPTVMAMSEAACLDALRQALADAGKSRRQPVTT